MKTTYRAGSVSLFVCGLLAACAHEPPPASAPTSPTRTPDPAWLERAASTCAKIASCTQGGLDKRLLDPSQCVDAWIARGGPEATDPLRTCLTNAKTCDQIAACVRAGGDTRAAAFCAAQKGVVSACDGDRFVTCGDDADAEGTVIDCKALGATCREQKAPGGLVVRGCFSPEKCPTNAPENRCDGDGAVISCHDGVVERSTCRPGTRCAAHASESGEPSASCELDTGRGRACGLSGTRRCEGDRVVECAERADASGKARVTDCKAYGLRCTGTGLRASCSIPTDVECDASTLPKCADGGKALAFCAAGRMVTVPCAQVGMGSCNPAARGAAAACSTP